MSSGERREGAGSLWGGVVAAGRSGGEHPAAVEFSVPDRVILSAQIGIDRLSYEALERAEIEILEDESHTLAVRLLAAHTLVAAAVAEYGRGALTTPSFAVWMEHMNAGYGQRWLFGEATSTRGASSGKRRAVLAPLIARMETRCARALGGQVSGGGLGCMLSLAIGRGRIHLPSIAQEVELGAVDRVGFEQDSPALRPLLVQYLVECVRRKALLRHTNLLKGIQYLLVRYSLVRWYAMALASARGLGSAGVDELREAAGVVERFHEAGDQENTPAVRMPSGFLMAVLLDMVVSPVDLVGSTAR